MVLTLPGSTVCVHPPAQAQEEIPQPLHNAHHAAPGQITATPASAVAQGSPPAPPISQGPHGMMTAIPVSVVLLGKLSARRECVMMMIMSISSRDSLTLNNLSFMN
jgi:hypothetical protein